ncbi:MAG: ABC transporter ATP-binding protein [Kiritimatiellae bacterium]|nr:ABC transporter ATP-binding protein [Kiritimatiellia bacterium]MDD3545070.1 ABC transporter ATP-binding protein [Kiritimatiellia bacterium]MDD4025489.1 ABC transporter ATP-binding protein [Kiritimatiellia bacterium]MDD4622971.1 ABC transporter ATP-binding protein [Kiritimatiellia bacterium]
MILLDKVSAAYGSRTVLDNLSMHVRRSERVALAGANGVGKSSLLRVITGQLTAAGTVRVDGQDPARLPPRKRARLMAVVPQEIPNDIPFSAGDFVMLGRTALLPRFSAPTAADLRAAEEAMRLTDTWDLRQRPFPEMSGGEQQRIALAMALSSRPEVILLDEPTSHLDLRHRIDLMRLLDRLCQERGITVLMVVHDLTLASQFFPRIALLHQGRVLSDGTPADVLRPDILQTAYGCPVSVFPLSGTPAICVLPRA